MLSLLQLGASACALSAATTLSLRPPLRVSGSAHARRALPRLGLGNELVWQSINDTALAAAVAESGSTVGRYPGGTPADYWDWQVGWPTDIPGTPVRRATPSDWASYSARAGNGGKQKTDELWDAAMRPNFESKP